MSLYSNNTDLKVIKRVQLTPSSQKRIAKVTVLVLVMKLDQEASRTVCEDLEKAQSLGRK